MSRQLMLGTLLVFVMTWSASFALAAPAWQLMIQPIQICDDAGLNCANEERELWEAEGDKIWAQAGIDLRWMPWTTLNETDFLGLTSMEFHEFLIADPPSYSGSSDPMVINMWFARFGTTAGVAECAGCRNIAIWWDVVKSKGSFDTMAHEIGHSLGLLHLNSQTGGDWGPENLMGTGRSYPQTIDDIFPDGQALDQLLQGQIETLLTSPYLKPIPEPGTLSLFGIGVAALIARRRNKD